MTPLQKRALIIGSGSCARKTAEDLIRKKIEIIVAAKDEAPDISFPKHDKNDSAEILPFTRLIQCTGSVGNFTVFMDQRGQGVIRSVSAIVVAEEDRREPNFSLYGLTPTSRVLSLSQLQAILSSSQQADVLPDGGKAVFLTGIFREGNPVIARETMQLSLRLQSEFRKQVYIFTRNLKVAGDGLEALYRKTRDAGVIYFKLDSALPIMEQKRDGRVAVALYDEISRQQFRLITDMTITDETIGPSEYLQELTKILKLDRDEAGFAQTGNVHRISIYTNRKGILAAGPARMVQSVAGHEIDASNAAFSVFKLVAEKIPTPENKAEIIRSRCVKCLTCYRVCPFKAIQLDTNPVVMTDACEGCGICAAECPKSTINIKGLSGSEISEKILKSVPINKAKDFVPFIVAFCCIRSAAMAWELASEGLYDLPPGLRVVNLPCAGSISLDHIFSALKKGADGIMVLTCHEGNCHSETGNVYARQKAMRVFDILTQMAFERERLVVKSLASNMAREFSQMAGEFEKQILVLGPSRIR